MAKQIEVIDPKETKLKVKIVGISPLLQSALTIEGYENPTKDENVLYKRCLYPKLKGKYTIKGGQIKGCMRDTIGTIMKGATKSKVKCAVIIPDEYIPIDSSSPHMRKFLVGKGDKKKVIRAQFDKWEAEFEIEFDPNVFTPDLIVNILNTGGHRVGIGPYRVACGGSFGRFKVVSNSK